MLDHHVCLPPLKLCPMIRTRSASADAGGSERDDPELLAGRAGGSAEPPQHRDDAGQKHQGDQDDAAAENHLDVRPGIDGVPAAVDAAPADQDEPEQVQPHPPPTPRGRPSATGPTGTCPRGPAGRRRSGSASAIGPPRAAATQPASWPCAAVPWPSYCSTQIP